MNRWAIELTDDEFAALDAALCTISALRSRVTADPARFSEPSEELYRLSAKATVNVMRRAFLRGSVRSVVTLESEAAE